MVKPAFATLTAVLRDDPDGFSKTSVDAPPEVQDAVECDALRKDPDQRYQSMADVKNSIEQIYFASRSGVMQFSSGSGSVRVSARAIPSVAVLPFLNLSLMKRMSISATVWRKRSSTR